MIFIYPLSRSSLATGPKIRVPLGSSALVQQYHCIIIETDIRTIFTAQFILGTYNNRFGYSTFFDTTCGNCILYGNYNLIANLGIILSTVTQYTDTKTSLAPLLSATFNLLSC